MDNRPWVMIAAIVGAFFLFRTRYRLLNAFLKRPWLRRLAVTSVLRIPAVRDRMMSQVLR
ncbi:hypothetical protein [Alteribacter populi]|uniref:hypothetical protein n=1 Tax=Alteribacter populi TaxID=2011011 RepID=UPI000BBB3464|nr:hypothetical protein [Alteribacter populi]